MKKYFFICVAAAILLSACGGKSDNSPTGGNAESKQLPEPVTTLQKAAKGYCDCTEGVDWTAIDMTNPDDPDLMAAVQKIMECSMEVSNRYGLPVIRINEENDSLRSELIARCPDVIKKCDEVSKLISSKFNGGK